jgi:hypothetical protein
MRPPVNTTQSFVPQQSPSLLNNTQLGFTGTGAHRAPEPVRRRLSICQVREAIAKHLLASE